jgi:RES domain-containing protein
VIPNHLDIVEVEHASIMNNEGLHRSDEYRAHLRTLGLDEVAPVRKVLEFYGEHVPPMYFTQEIGSSIECLVLSVPSAIVPGERNFVIHPDHPAFTKIEFRDSVPFQFDPRLRP